MINVSNKNFLTAIFGVDAPFCHVTDFTYDPGNIPKNKQLIAWKGDYFNHYHFQPESNQYFVISTFYADDQGKARRRKALYRQTHCVVLDDVREKLNEKVAQKLPIPSWILETSKDSLQWGYILTTPCTKPERIDNLHEGLIYSDLAPDDKDPGQKGITRYVRLPEGFNNKVSKLIKGQPFKCQMLSWQPFNTVELKQLAAPFNIDLDATRRETRINGASAIADHPLINIPDIIHIKEIRSDGRFDITCPWVNEHTNNDDSGACLFTNNDNSIGFKCHHGACQSRTGRDMLLFIEMQLPGFGATFNDWKVIQNFLIVKQPNFIDPLPMQSQKVSFFNVKPILTSTEEGLTLLTNTLMRQHPSNPEARQSAAQLLKIVDTLSKIDQKHWHDQVCSLMNWNKVEFHNILKDLRQQWHSEKINNADFYDNVIFIKEQNQFYDWKSCIFFTVDAFQNSFSSEDENARKNALQGNRVKKVDRLDYAPLMPKVFTDGGIIYGNSWCNDNQLTGIQGDISTWYNHFEVMGWVEHRNHVEKWMAFTLRHPDQKINHMLIFGGAEGVGKDFLLAPLTKAMEYNYSVISGEELLTGFNDYLLSTKYLHINEVEMADHRDSKSVSNKLKPIASAPPNKIRINQKYTKPIGVRNIINGTMGTNDYLPVKLNGPSRRFYAMWTDLNIRGKDGDYLPLWRKYWNDAWIWMNDVGCQFVIWHLMNVVDLSDFNPGEAPPITDYLRDIRDASKSPMCQTVEAFIYKKIGAFQCDLVTATDLISTLKVGQMIAPNEMYVDGKFFTPTKVGQQMKELGKVQLRAHYLSNRIKLWVLRDIEKYQDMNSSTLYHEYEKQMQNARANTALTVIN